MATLTFGPLGCDTQSPSVQLCALVTAIANDPLKRSYIKKWIGSHLEDKRFRESLRDFPVLRSGDSRTEESGDFDWQYLGIAEGIGSLEFHGPVDSSGKVDAARINAVELSAGRSSIFVRLNSEISARQTWSSERLVEMKVIDDDVFVFCDNGS